MRTVRARRELPGARIAQAEALWYDTSRWPAFVDGFGHVEKLEGPWPRTGARVLWDSKPGGRGRVVERVIAHEPRVSQSAEVEDSRLAGTQTVSFRALAGDGGCELTLELAYELKAPGLGGALTDALFVRRALRDSLSRTVGRFATELAAERELEAP